jgi:hypothetical protein
MKREKFISEGNFKCLDVDIYGWSSPDGEPVSLILYPKDVYDVEDNLVSIELTLDEINAFCTCLKACKERFEGES